MRADAWVGANVFLTGHTGFKGAWLALWLTSKGANVYGYALDPLSADGVFKAAGVSDLMSSDTRADLRDLEALSEAMQNSNADVIFHLAAQPLVRQSYADPLETLETNVLGTARVLEAAKKCTSAKAILIITTDKVYQNNEWPHPYRETDQLGGNDIYSASKAAAELITASYRASFFPQESALSVVTARAGNVVGGGDYSTDRLVPDCLIAHDRGGAVNIRYPRAVRPWQHVLEPLSGYVLLAEKLLIDGSDSSQLPQAFNFGPDASGNASVGEVVSKIRGVLGGGFSVNMPESEARFAHEAGLLQLDSSLARATLGWCPRWDLNKALRATVLWHQKLREGCDMREFTLAQISEYEAQGVE